MRLRLKGVSRDVNGDLCVKEITTHDGRRVASGGECQWEGLVVIEKGMERHFDFVEPKPRRAKR